MVSMGEIWPQLGSLTGSFMVIFAISYQFFYPYAHINFDECGVDQFTRSDAYVNIENYHSVNSSRQATVLRAVQFAKKSGSPLLRIDENGEVTDEFQGVKVWWSSRTSPRAQPSSSSDNPDRDERRYYKLTFHKHNLDFITNSYVPHVLKEGKAIALRQRERKLYSNNPGWSRNGTSKWSQLAFEHPATFETSALDPKMKGDLVKDLIKFSPPPDRGCHPVLKYWSSMIRTISFERNKS